MQSLRGRPLLQIVMLRDREHRILEDRSRTLAIGIARHNQHSLERANVPHGLANFGKIRCRLASFEVPLQVGISEVRLASRRDRVHHAKNDETFALRGIENTRAICEATGLIAKFAYLTVFQVEDLNRLDRLRNFLPVSADVLYWSAAHAARNPAQALNSRAVRHDRMRHEAIPGFSSAHVEQNLTLIVVPGPLLDAGDRDFQDEPWPAGICHDQVAPTTQHKQRQVPSSRQRNRLLDLINGLRTNEEPRGPPHFEGRQRRERNIFLKQHRFDYTTAFVDALLQGLRRNNRDLTLQ